MVNFWKIAPGDNAFLWDECREQECITINWMNQTDFSQFETKEDLRNAMIEAGDSGRGADSIWAFVHGIQRGDTVVANKGNHQVVGVGVVGSEYLPPKDEKNPRKEEEQHCHARKVEWRIVDRIDLPNEFFGHIPPTVLKLESDQCDKIKRAYLKKYPQLKETLDELFDEQDSQEGATMKTLLEQFRQAVGDAKYKDVLEQVGSATLDKVDEESLQAYIKETDWNQLYVYMRISGAMCGFFIVPFWNAKGQAIAWFPNNFQFVESPRDGNMKVRVAVLGLNLLHPLQKVKDDAANQLRRWLSES